MVGNLANGLAILIGGLAGVLVGAKIPQKIQDRMLEGVGACVTFLGLSMALDSTSMPILIFSMVLGGALGEVLSINDRIGSLGVWVDQKLAQTYPDAKIMEGLITACLIYMVGSMAILGPIQAGLTGDNSTLFSKAILDGLTSIVLGSTLGIGVGLAGIPTFLYQMVFFILASLVEPYISPAMIADMTASGGLVIFLIGLNVLKITEVPVANFIPASFMPILIHGLIGLVA